MSFSYKNHLLMHRPERCYCLYRKDDNIVETKIDKQIQPFVGIAAISNFFVTMSKTPVR